MMSSLASQDGHRHLAHSEGDKCFFINLETQYMKKNKFPLQKNFVNKFFVFAWEFCIEKWRGFLVNFSGLFPKKRSTKTPQKIRGKFGAKFGTKIRKIRGIFVLRLFWPNNIQKKTSSHYRVIFSIERCFSLTTLTSLNKEVRPLFLSDNSIWSFPSFCSLSDYSVPVASWVWGVRPRKIK